MRFGTWLGLLALVLLPQPAVAEVPGCDGMSLPACLGVPAPRLDFTDDDPALTSPLVREPGLDDRRWREALNRKLKTGEAPGAAWIELAWLALRRGDVKLAKSQLDQAEALVAGEPELERRLVWSRGHACAAEGNFDCALSAWHRAGSLFPGRASWLFRHYALALWGLGRHEQALTWYTAAVRGTAYLGRGSYAARSGGAKALDAVARELFQAWSERYAPLASTVTAEVDIDAEGWVSRVVLLDNPLDARLQDRIRLAVAGWRFTPVDAQGQPQSLSTHLYIDVRGRPAPEGGHDFEIQYTGAGLGYVTTKPPRYPPEALRKLQQGDVLVKVEVAPEGTVSHVSIEAGSGYPLLDKAAAKAVSDWTFKVDRVNGRPVSSWALVPISFRLAGFGSGPSQLYFNQQRIRANLTSPMGI